MKQRHTLRAARVHADTRTSRRRDRGADERAVIDEQYPDWIFASRGLAPWEIEDTVSPTNDHQAARAARQTRV